MQYQISIDTETKLRVLSRLEKAFTRKRQGIHVTDLIWARRKVLSEKYPLPLTPEEVLFYTAGKGHHDMVSMLKEEKDMVNVQIEVDGINGEIDLVWDKVYEIKTTRASVVHEPKELPAHYIQQLSYYVTLWNKFMRRENIRDEDEGGLLILYLFARNHEDKTTVPYLQAWRLRFTNLKHIWEEMCAIKESILACLADKENISVLPMCPQWACKRCKYKTECFT